MTDGPDKKRSLREIAKAKRDAAVGIGRSRERTTLNVNDPDDQAGTSTPPDALGEALVDRGLISRHQLFNALNESYHQDCTLRQALVSLGYISEDALKDEGF